MNQTVDACGVQREGTTGAGKGEREGKTPWKCDEDMEDGHGENPFAGIPVEHLLFMTPRLDPEAPVETFARHALPKACLTERKRQLSTVWGLLPGAVKFRFRQEGHQLCQFGMSSRTSALPTKAAILYPHTTLLLTKIVQEVFPKHLFTTVSLKANPQNICTGVHKDLKNANLPTAILGIQGTQHCGIWIEDSQGAHFCEHQGVILRGTVRDIDQGLTFSAKQLWHSGVERKGSCDTRLTLIAYVGRNVLSGTRKLQCWLDKFGFVQPTPTQVEAASHDVCIAGHMYRQSQLRARRSEGTKAQAFLCVDTSRKTPDPKSGLEGLALESSAKVPRLRL